MLTLVCKTCAKPFKVWPCRKNAIYCNRKCYKRIGSDNPKWKGGFLINDGYKYIYKPNHPDSTQMGYVLEHRLVMEEKIGRRLNKNETIHHLNHNRLDNRPENLHLCISNGRHFIDHHLINRDSKGQFNLVQKSQAQ